MTGVQTCALPILVGADLVAWRERLGLPIEAADKAGKRAWQEMLNGDIRRGRILYRDGSPLLDEHRHLVRLPGTVGKQGREHADRRLPDGRVPGNHISDGWLYIYRHLTHHLHRPAVQRDEGLAREERMLEEGLDRMAGAVEAQKRAAGDFEDDGWEFANW